MSIDMEVIDAIPQCRRLTLNSVIDGRAVTQADLDFVKINNWVADTFAAFAFESDGAVMERLGGGVAGEKQDIIAAKDFQRARRGKRKITPQLIKEAAAVYRKHFSDNPIQKVSAAMGVGERMASEYIRLARTEEYGFLPKTNRGQKKI